MVDSRTPIMGLQQQKYGIIWDFLEMIIILLQPRANGVTLTRSSCRRIATLFRFLTCTHLQTYIYASSNKSTFSFLILIITILITRHSPWAIIEYHHCNPLITQAFTVGHSRKMALNLNAGVIAGLGATVLLFALGLLFTAL